MVKQLVLGLWRSHFFEQGLLNEFVFKNCAQEDLIAFGSVSGFLLDLRNPCFCLPIGQRDWSYIYGCEGGALAQPRGWSFCLLLCSPPRGIFIENKDLYVT